MRTPRLSLLLLLLSCLAGSVASAQTYMYFTISQPAPPSAAFSYVQNNLSYTFSDLSGGSPVSWHWDFGNGDTSAVQNPTQTYASGGNYIICLTVHDQNNCSATSCDTIVAVGVDAPQQLRDLRLSPNPFDGQTFLQFGLTEASPVVVRVFDLHGALVEEVVQGELPAGTHRHAIGASLAQGTYMVVIRIHDQSLARRVVKVQ